MLGLRIPLLFFLTILLSALVVHPETAGAQQDGSSSTPTEVVVSKSLEAEGLTVELRARPLAGQAIRQGGDIEIGFKLTNSQTGKGLSHLHPAAWLSRHGERTALLNQEACEQQIAGLLRKGLIHRQADIDLNSYFILTLNADSTLGIVDPTVNLRTANLAALIPFEGQAAQWALDAQRGKVYITLPETGNVAVIDIDRRALQTYLEVGVGVRRVEAQPDGQYIWIANDHDGTVTAINAKDQSKARKIAVGPAPLDLAVDTKGEHIFVGSGGEGILSILDVKQMKISRTVAIGKGKPLLTYSPLANSIYAADSATGTVHVVDVEKGSNVKQIQLPSEITALSVTPDGRFVLALMSKLRKVGVLDTAFNMVVGELATEEDPDLIAFTTDYAYVRNRGTPNVTVIRLSGLSDLSKTPTLSIPFGSVPPAESQHLEGVDTISAFPHGGHSLVLNPSDRTVYMYMEGMMAPMSSFRTYTGRPVGILFYDRGLREGSVEGEYSATVRFEEPGGYDVLFYLDTPSVPLCFELEVKEDPEIQKNRPAKIVLQNLFNADGLQPGVVSAVRFRLVNQNTGTPMLGLEDVVVLSFMRGSHWQDRVHARHMGEGVYEADIALPQKGSYVVLVESRALGLQFGDLDPIAFNVLE